jgi:hypothetical protein
MYDGPVSSRHLSYPARLRSIAPAWYSAAYTGALSVRRSVTPAPHGPQTSGVWHSNDCG